MRSKDTTSIEQLQQQRYDRNCELLRKLREDDHAKELLESCNSDADAGRMTTPKPLELVQLTSQSLSPRFAVVQGSIA